MDQLYTYSLIRCLYNRGEDYIDSFWPLIVNILPKDQGLVPFDMIQELINEKYGLFVPQHSLKVIITRATRNGYIQRRERKCFLTNKGIKYLNDLKPEREDERRINELVEGAREYLKSQGISLTPELTKISIESLLKENLEYFEQFLIDDGKYENNAQIKTKKYYPELINYFSLIEKNNPTLFETLQDIVFGSIISTVIYGNDIAESSRKFENTTIYFDSNFIFSLLGLRFQEENKPAQELFSLIKRENCFSLRIFDFTIEEIINVLKKYQREQHKYLPKIKISSLYSSMKSQGWTSADVREFIVDIENRLWKLGIKITPTKVDLLKYEPKVIDHRSALANYKPFQGIKEQNHDLASIENIKDKRNKIKYKLEESEFLFLTSDLKLAKYNYHEDNHKNKNSISEVIPDKLLTNILWLKNPNLQKELHLNSLISVHSRQVFIDRSVWESFYVNLIKMRSEGKINDMDITILLYDNQIQDILNDVNSDSIQTIEANWILDKIIEAKSRVDDEKKNELENQKISLEETFEKRLEEVKYEQLQSKEKLISEQNETERKLNLLEERIKQIEKEKESNELSVLNAISNWKKKQELSAESITNKLVIFIDIMFFLILIIVALVFIKPVINNWDIIEPLAWLISILFSIGLFFLGKQIEPKTFKSKIRDKLFNLIYQRKLKQIGEIETKIEITKSAI